MKFGAVGGKDIASVPGHKSCTKRLVEWRCRIWMSMVYVKILFRTHLQLLQQHRCVRAGPEAGSNLVERHYALMEYVLTIICPIPFKHLSPLRPLTSRPLHLSLIITTQLHQTVHFYCPTASSSLSPHGASISFLSFPRLPNFSLALPLL